MELFLGMVAAPGARSKSAFHCHKSEYSNPRNPPALIPGKGHVCSVQQLATEFEVRSSKELTEQAQIVANLSPLFA